jgi:RimJ/RimL family protein N-acetyltransferase
MKLRLEPPAAEDERIIATWRSRDRLEMLTCRPVVNGKRIPANPEVIAWMFWREGLAEPVGRFTYFDVNPRNRSAEFGYRVNPDYRNQGIGSQLLTTALTHLQPFLLE